MKNVGFSIKAGGVDWYEFGYSETLYSWFSTICYLLEDNRWGGRYPLVMNQLYFDERNGIPYEKVKEFEAELKDIENKFKTIDSKKAIWSCEKKIYIIPKGMLNIDYTAKTLDKLYIKKHYPNQENKTIFELLYQCIKDMDFYITKYKKVNLYIEAE